MAGFVEPTGLLEGKPQRVRLGLRNTTASAWSREGETAVHLAAQLVRPDNWQPLDLAIAIELVADILPGCGGYAVAELPPMAAGPYELLTRVRCAAETRGIAAIPLRVLEPSHYACGRLELAEAVPSLPAGVTVTLPLRLSNLSPVTWARWPHPLQVWVRLGDQRSVTPVLADLESGRSMILHVDLQLPATPGRHRLRLSLARPRTLTFAEHEGFQVAAPMLEIHELDPMTLDPRFRQHENKSVQLALLPGQEARGILGQPLALKLPLLNVGASAVELVSVTVACLGDETIDERLPIEARMAPGSRRAFELTLPPPERPGQKDLAVSALVRLHDGDTLAVALGSLPLRVTLGVVSLALRVTSLQPESPTLLGEQVQHAAFRFVNEGAAAIQGKGVEAFSISQRWTRLDEKRPVQYRGGQRMPLEIAAGDSLVVTVLLAPPPETGRYRLELVVFRQPEDDGHREEARCEVGEYRIIRVRELAFADEKLQRRALANADEQAARLAYRGWCENHDCLAGATLERARMLPEAWPNRPLVSVLLLAEEATLAKVAVTAASLAEQVYPHWELCISLGRGLNAGALVSALGGLAGDSRIHLCSGPAKRDVALLRQAARRASGAYLQWLRPGDRLAPSALLFLLGEALRRPSLAAVYSDRDSLAEDGGRSAPAPLPDFDLDLALGSDGLLHGALVTAGPFRTALAAVAMDSPLLMVELPLHLLEAIPTKAIGHVRHSLVHLGASLELPPAHWAAGAALVQAHLLRRGLPARVARMHDAPCFRLVWPLPDPAPRVSILIPTRDGLALLAACIGSILERTDYPDYEIIVIDNESTEPEVLAYLAELETAGHARVLRDQGDFNWARVNNDAVKVASGELLCLLNNDTEVLDRGWLWELVAQACRPEVGVVGPALWYPSGLLQHGGVMFDAMDGRPVHMLLQAERGAVPDRMRVVRQCSAVTGACLVVRRAVYEAVGGMDQVHLPIGYNDIDFCLRVRNNLELATLWTPFAELLHKESASRGSPRTQQDRDRHLRELAVFRGRWLDAATADPFADGTLLPKVGERAPPPPGVAIRYNRYQLPRPRPMVFLNLPRCAGMTVRDTLRRDTHGLMVSDLSPRLLLGVSAGDRTAMTELRCLLASIDILVARCGYGFGAAASWDCTYGILLRNPIERVAAQARHLREDPRSPLLDAGLNEIPMATLLRKGVLRGNLAVHRLLGAAPEPVGWAEVDGMGAEFAGYYLPPAIWRRQAAEVLAAPDVEPEVDLGLVDRALTVLQTRFAFVGLHEALPAHLSVLAECLGGETSRLPLHLNRSSGSYSWLTADERSLLKVYNKLDFALLERIRSIPGGLILDKERLIRRNG